MNTITKRRVYLQPEIELIQLDNTISLALQSVPPGGPGESRQITPNVPEQFIKHPFDGNLG